MSRIEPISQTNQGSDTVNKGTLVKDKKRAASVRREQGLEAINQETPEAGLTPRQGKKCGAGKKLYNGANL